MTKKLKRLEHEIYAHDGKTFEDIGHIKVIFAEDLPRCESCEFCLLKSYEIPNGFGDTEKWTDGYYCSHYDHDVESDDFCAWWEERQ